MKKMLVVLMALCLLLPTLEQLGFSVPEDKNLAAWKLNNQSYQPGEAAPEIGDPSMLGVWTLLLGAAGAMGAGMKRLRKR